MNTDQTRHLILPAYTDLTSNQRLPFEVIVTDQTTLCLYGITVYEFILLVDVKYGVG
jgi:hypothetical protein